MTEGSERYWESRWRDEKAENDRLRRGISAAMGCIDPMSYSADERLGWIRLLDALEGREPRAMLSPATREGAAS